MLTQVTQVPHSHTTRMAFRRRRFPVTSGRGAGTPKLAQIFAYDNWLYPYRMLLHGASDLDQRYLKMCSFNDGCTFLLKYLPLLPKIPQNPIFGDILVQTLL